LFNQMIGQGSGVSQLTVFNARGQDSCVVGDDFVVPSWLALCWIALGSGFESQRGHLFWGISPRGRYHRRVLSRGLFPLLP
jgi:hypothetical protein